jgi:hypothetical protein
MARVTTPARKRNREYTLKYQQNSIVKAVRANRERLRRKRLREETERANREADVHAAGTPHPGVC